MILIILEFSRALGETADGPAELIDHEGVRVIAPIRPHLRARPEEYFVGEGWVRLAMWLTSASPGGFHDWKTLYQDRHRFYMWLHTYLDEAKLHYCSPTVPLLQIKDNADPIYKKQQ